MPCSSWLCLSLVNCTRWPKNEAITFDRWYLTLHNFKMHEPICMIFGVYFNAVLFWTRRWTLVYVKFVTESGGICREWATQIVFRHLLQEFKHKMWSRTRLQNRINSNSYWMMEIEAVHVRLEQQLTLCFVGDLICSEAQRKILQAWGISEWWCCLECVLQQKCGQIFNWYNDVSPIDFS